MPDPNKAPTTFAELAKLIEHMPIILVNARRARHLSQRAMALQAGMSFSTVSRIENGQEMNSDSLLAVLRWLDAGGFNA